MKEKIHQAFSLKDNEFSKTLETVDAVQKAHRSLLPFSDEEKDSLQSYDEAFLVRFAYNSSALEGSTLSLIDTELVLEGEFVPDKPGREQFMARGVAEGYAFVVQALEEGYLFDEDFIKDIHQRTALDNQPRTRGVYRTIMNYMLMSQGYPPVALKNDDRKGYLDSLATWQIDGEPLGFVSLVCNSLEGEIKARTEAVEITREATEAIS